MDYVQLPEGIREDVKQTIKGFIPLYKIPDKQHEANIFWSGFQRKIDQAWGLSFKNRKHRASENKRKSRSYLKEASIEEASNTQSSEDNGIDKMSVGRLLNG